MNAPINDYDFSDYGIRFNNETFAFFLRGLVVTKEEASAQESRLAIASKFQDKFLTSEQYPTIHLKHPEIYREIVELGLSCNCFDSEPSIDELVLGYIELENGGEQSLASYAFEEIINSAQNILWYFKRYDAIQDAVAKIKEERLLKLMQIDKTRRIHDDLSRTFYRGLTELRKHQEWRRRALIVDISPKEGDGSKRLEE